MIEAFHYQEAHASWATASGQLFRMPTADLKLRVRTADVPLRDCQLVRQVACQFGFVVENLRHHLRKSKLRLHEAERAVDEVGVQQRALVSPHLSPQLRHDTPAFDLHFCQGIEVLDGHADDFDGGRIGICW